MSRIYCLYSSSKGNATFIGTEKGGILIDAGVSCRKLIDGLAVNNIPYKAVQGIFITHDHSDHIQGLRVFTEKTGCEVYGQSETLQILTDTGQISPKSRITELTKKVTSAGMELTPFNTPHDSAQSCGYRIHTADDKYCAVCTDLGHVTPEVQGALTGCRFVLLESNYDENMLRMGRYPFHLKQRILSDTGHLSNNGCTAEIGRLIAAGTTHFILGHLSQENNRPWLAYSTVESGLSQFRQGRDYLLGVAPVETQGGVVVF